MRLVGTLAFGIRTPLVKQGDDLEKIVVDSVLAAMKSKGLEFRDRDIVGITESSVARTQGNFVALDVVSQDIHEKFGDEVGVVFPIFSRNRFSLILKAIARGVKKAYVLLPYPNDEVGNPVVDPKKIWEQQIDTFAGVYTEDEFRAMFAPEDFIHPFTGVDITKYYRDLSKNIEVIFANNPTAILKYTKNVLAADIHTRFRTKEILRQAGAEKVYSLDEIMNQSIDGSGYNNKYGLLGSNYSTDEVLKLFPINGQTLVDGVAKKLRKATGKQIEVLVYGDGAFKDPVAGIWELADPVVSPAYTKGLLGTPHELKLKFLIDNSGMSDEEIIAKIGEKNANQRESLGTTPRQITDLVGSLCDLISGSGDKGTPIVYVQGYFDKYSDE